MSARKNRDRLNAFDDKTELEAVADEIFGKSEGAGISTGRINAPPTDIDEIWADVRQPRRVIPASIRLVWNGNPADVPRLLDTWAAVAGDAAGRTIDIQSVILGEGDGIDTDGTPAIYESYIALLRLAGSIRRDGLINPITIVSGRDHHLIESGERRWLAYWMLRLHTPNGDEFTRIPAVKVSGTDYVWRQAAENTARRNLNAVGMARQLALLVMAARGADNYAEYEQIVPPGGSDRRFYAQVADGNAHRIPKGTAERIQAAMGLSMEQISRYRNLLRLTDDEEINDVLWMNGDIGDWPERAFRDVDTLPMGKVRQIVSRASWSLDDFRTAAAPPAQVVQPTPPPTPSALPPVGTRQVSPPAPHYAGAEAAEADRILEDLRAAFDRAYALELDPNPAAQLLASRAYIHLNQAQTHYDNNRLMTARQRLDSAFRILDEPIPAPADEPAAKEHPKPNTHDPYMSRIYDAWRSGYKENNLLLITQDGESYIAIGKDDSILRGLRRDINAGGIGLTGSADYTLVSKISADLMAEVIGQYSGDVLAFSYADLDEDMQHVAGTAFRARNIPLNTLPTASTPTASDNPPSLRLPEKSVINPGDRTFTILINIRNLANAVNNPDAYTAANDLLEITREKAQRLKADGLLNDTLQTYYDSINGALTDWSQALGEMLDDLDNGE